MENNDNQPIITHGKLQGYLRRDSFGRLFIDKCQTDDTHLTVKTEGNERPGCRTYLEDVLVPDGVLEKNVQVYFEIRIKPCTENQ